jgi:hypothetical protein
LGGKKNAISSFESWSKTCGDNVCAAENVSSKTRQNNLKKMDKQATAIDLIGQMCVGLCMFTDRDRIYTWAFEFRCRGFAGPRDVARSTLP